MICDIRFVFVFYVLFYGCEALRWTKYLSSSINSDTVISMMIAKSTPQIDVSSGVQVTIIRNAKKFDRGIIVYCFISGYNDKSPIEYSFCKDNDCVSVNDGTYLKRTAFNFPLTMESNFTSPKGVKLGFQLLGTDYDFSGNYYCKATNKKFGIRSNILEIRDTIFWGNNLFTNTVTEDRTSISMVSLSSIPHVMNCSDGKSVRNPTAPKWTNAEFFSPVQWSVCPVMKSDLAQAEKNKMTLTKCLQYSKDKCEESINNMICPQSVTKMPDWETYVNQGGDLIFMYIRPQTSSDIDSYTLMCYTKSQSDELKPLFHYYTIQSEGSIAKGVSFDASTPAILQSLMMISPQTQSFILYAKKIPKDTDMTTEKKVAIYALFKSSPTAISIWKQGGTTLNSNQNMQVSKYSVTFLGDITSDMAGVYTLEVTDKTEKLMMTINVQVLGPPILIMSACMAPLLYVWDGGSASISCPYKQQPKQIHLEINSQVIKLSDSLENSKAILKVSNPYLEMLSFTMSPTNYALADEVTISYSVFNLTKSQGHSQYQDHTVTFVAENDFGNSVRSSSIYVLPRLSSIVTEFPEKYNCTSPCSSSQTHTFKCSVNVNEYANKELIIQHYWTINSNKLGADNTDPANMFARYFQVDPVTKVLTMLPITSNDTASAKFVKDALKKNFIECHVNIFPLNKAESTFEYYSTSDSSLGSTMKASITLDYEPLNTAYIYWIVAVILGLIVLVIIIVLLTRYCMRNKGDTYKLDKLEREHGYDPDKEVQEEMFKPYERQDQDLEASAPYSTDGRKLSITGHSVGSNDDGDLDNYDLDESNFKEDGSIVGMYASNPRDRAAMN